VNVCAQSVAIQLGFEDISLYYNCILDMGCYVPTEKDKEAFKKWRKGKSIGFTMRSSLKAKGLIPRASGKKIVSDKYKCKGGKTKRKTQRKH
jgi:hypothetical protein